MKTQRFIEYGRRDGVSPGTGDGIDVAFDGPVR